MAALSLEVEVAVDTPKAADGIVEDTVVRRGQGLLNVAWIVMIGGVDDLYSPQKLDAMAAKLEIKRILDLQIEAGEGGKAPCPIARPCVVPVFVEVGV